MPSNQRSLLSLVVLLLPAFARGFTSGLTHLQIHKKNRQEAVTPLSAAGGNVIEINDTNFKNLFKGDKPILIDCMAQWCGPCKLLEPVLERCSENWADGLVVGSFDVQSGNSNELKVELALLGALPRALPTLILFQNGKVLTQLEGLLSDEELNELLNENIIPADKQNAVIAEELVSTATRKSGFISFAKSTADDYMLTA